VVVVASVDSSNVDTLGVWGIGTLDALLDGLLDTCASASVVTEDTGVLSAVVVPHGRLQQRATTR
jgi:hypothetical protein